MKKKPIAIFDIDGTIFRSSLLIELNEKLVRAGIFPDSARRDVRRVREAWLNRKGSYTNYINTIIELYGKDIKGKRVADVRKISRELIREQKHRVYIYTRQLIKQLRGSHILVIISFSPMEVVKAFNAYYKFGIVSGLPYGYKRGVYIGGVEQGFTIDKKALLTKLVREHGLSLEGSIGVGDTESDAAFLRMVDHPVVFNPNKKLYKLAQRNGWKVVVERKDMIYEI